MGPQCLQFERDPSNRGMAVPGVTRTTLLRLCDNMVSQSN